MWDKKELSEQLVHIGMRINNEALDILLREPQKAADYVHELVTIEQLHTSEELVQKAAQLLSIQLDADQRQYYRDAFELFRFVKQYRERTIGKSLQASLQVHLDAFEAIRTVFEPLISFNLLYALAYSELGADLHAQFGQSETARNILEGLVKYDTSEAGPFRKLGRVYVEYFKDYHKAAKCYETALQIESYDRDTYERLADIEAEHFKAYDRAIEHYERALEDSPYNMSARIKLLAIHYDVKKNYDYCRQLIEQVLDFDYENAVAQYYLAKLHWQQEEDYDNAEFLYKHGVSRPTPAESALMNFGRAEMYVEGLQEFDIGRQYYERSLNMMPSNKRHFDKFKELLLNHYQGYSEVLHSYQQFLDADPNNAQIHYELAQFITNYIHDYPLAEKHLKRALVLEPNLEAARVLLDSYQ